MTMDYSTPEATGMDSDAQVTQSAPTPEQVVERLQLAPIINAQGQTLCQVCDRPFPNLQQMSVHSRKTHFDRLTRDMQLRLPGVTLCHVDGCQAVFLNEHRLLDHRRTVHGMRARGGSTKPPKSLKRPKTDVVRHQQPPRRNGVPQDVTVHEAGLAILMGLAPDGMLPVQRLGDVLDWLARGEAIVNLANENPSSTS